MPALCPTDERARRKAEMKEKKEEKEGTWVVGRKAEGDFQVVITTGIADMRVFVCARG